MDQETVYALGAIDEALARLKRRRDDREFDEQLRKLLTVRNEIVSEIISASEESDRRRRAAAEAEEPARREGPG